METVEEIAQGRFGLEKMPLRLDWLIHLVDLMRPLPQQQNWQKLKYNLVDYPKFDDDLESILLGMFSKVKSKSISTPARKICLQNLSNLVNWKEFKHEFLIR